MMTRLKGGGVIDLCDVIPDGIVIILRRTSQVGATHLMVSLTPADAPTHLLPGHAGVGAGVVGLVTNVLAVLVGVITPWPHRGVTGRGLGQLPTFTAASPTITICAAAAGLPGLEAAVLISGVGPELASVRSAETEVTQPDAQITAHGLPRVVADVRVGGAFTSPHSSQNQQWDY